ncbi:MAG TPA: trypsin-like peptidase domain-containing protein [Candidatus Limnocylindrales bacterium]|jgi:S1-C subfamily serine protease|nr:trypsin-like peptidase domain-containing protein [Candidatus Limnocylindrales bacterium]
MSVNLRNQLPQTNVEPQASQAPERLVINSSFCPFSLRKPLTRTAQYLARLLFFSTAVTLFAAEPDIRRDAAVIATEQVIPCVVNIATETVIEYHEWYDDLLRQFYGWPNTPVRQEKSISLGSGVIVDEEGYVLTNFHVVRRANRIQVKLWDGREYDADAVMTTESSDVALLKLKTKPGEKFKAIRFAPDDDLLLGETVLAVGNPYGLGGAVTKGILSSKNRRPSTGKEPLDVEDWLQTDAAINPGNSGGPLVNLRGELIGLNVAVYLDERGQRGPGVGFSIPVKQVSAALSRYFTPEQTDSLWFGAQVKSGPGPLVVTSVQAGSPAARAGLQAGDQLLQINAEKPQSLIAVNRLLVSEAEKPVAIAIARGSDHKTVKVRLMPLEDLIRQKLGLTLLEATPRTAQRLGIRPGEGLFVEEVEKGGPADQAQLQRGYIVTAIEGQKATHPRIVAVALAELKKGDAAHLMVIVPRRIGSSFVEFHQGTVEVEVR